MLKGTMVRPSPICRSYRAWTSLYFNSSSTHLPIGTYSIIHGHRCLVFACILRVLPGIYKFVLDSADTVEYWYGGILLIYQKPPDDRPRQPWILSSEIISQLGNYLENSPQHSSCHPRLGFWLHQTPARLTHAAASGLDYHCSRWHDDAWGDHYLQHFRYILLIAVFLIYTGFSTNIDVVILVKRGFFLDYPTVLSLTVGYKGFNCMPDKIWKLLYQKPRSLSPAVWPSRCPVVGSCWCAFRQGWPCPLLWWRPAGPQRC